MACTNPWWRPCRGRTAPTTKARSMNMSQLIAMNMSQLIVTDSKGQRIGMVFSVAATEDMYITVFMVYQPR